MTGVPGEATRAVKRALAEQGHERARHLIDAVAIAKALEGSPVALTELERDAVIVIADTDGIDREITAAGLGISRSGLDWAIIRQRRRVPALTRDLWAAVMLRPAADLVSAVRAHDPDAVASVLLGLDRQRLAALAVVLASMLADADLTTSATAQEHAST